MERWQIRCPACHLELDVPASYRGNVARCGHCHARFRLPNQGQASGDEIANWLEQEDEDREAGESVPEERGDLASEIPHSGETMVLPAVDETIQLVGIDARGAMLQFSARRLRDPSFLCSMPRRCLECSAASHLRTYVTVWSADPPGLSLADESITTGRMVGDEHLWKLEGKRFLSHLPREEDGTPHGSLSIPFWLCDMCTGARAIAGQILTDPQSGDRICTLLIGNPRRAEEFVLAADQKGTPTGSRLREWVEAVPETPWEHLSLVVRRRFDCGSTPKETRSLWRTFRTGIGSVRMTG